MKNNIYYIKFKAVEDFETDNYLNQSLNYRRQGSSSSPRGGKPRNLFYGRGD
jgi:hypothetical protein